VSPLADGCFYCYKKTRRITSAGSMCAGCDRAHKQEEDAIVKKKMIMGDLLGADCTGIVAGYMLCFFGKKRVVLGQVVPITKNESPHGHQMDPLFEEIHRKLREDPRMHHQGFVNYSGPGTIHSAGCCNIVFYNYKDRMRCHDTKYWIIFNPGITCEGCADIFSASLPPVGTFLQRRRLVDVLTVNNNAMGCLYCYRETRCITSVGLLCARCDRAHKQEGNELIEKKNDYGRGPRGRLREVSRGLHALFFWVSSPAKLNRARV
jgi:hypothetical protein